MIPVIFRIWSTILTIYCAQFTLAIITTTTNKCPFVATTGTCVASCSTQESPGLLPLPLPAGTNNATWLVLLPYLDSYPHNTKVRWGVVMIVRFKWFMLSILYMIICCIYRYNCIYLVVRDRDFIIKTGPRGEKVRSECMDSRLW